MDNVVMIKRCLPPTPALFEVRTKAGFTKRLLPTHSCFPTSCSSSRPIGDANRILYHTIIRAGTADGKLVADQSSQSKEAEQQLQKRLQFLAESMVLPVDYLSELPNDLRSDLREAAFALSSGPVQRQCGELAGEILIRLSQAWEKGDAQAVASAAEQLPNVLPSDFTSRAAIGKRLVGAGKFFASTGYYAEGELQKIAEALTAAGEALYVTGISDTREEPLRPTTRFYKFGDLQVAVTAQNCYIGSVIALLFGALSWGLVSSLQNIPGSLLRYPNDNAVLLATSLRGTLVILGYSCTLSSCLAMMGLLALAIQLSSEENIDN